mmetsp:Transcript_8290/g.25699  ORF Transcript_8290/g.25699 Transcript_8290/m.25699 type:complete len:100 (-) Transcript_8290:197-496(-)
MVGPFYRHFRIGRDCGMDFISELRRVATVRPSTQAVHIFVLQPATGEAEATSESGVDVILADRAVFLLTDTPYKLSVQFPPTVCVQRRHHRTNLTRSHQ